MAIRCFSYLVLMLALSVTVTVTASAYVHKCVYTFFVQTGDRNKAGTDATIGLTLGDSGLRSVEVPDLTKWGLMKVHRNYFERGNLDIFSGRDACLEPPVCSLKLVSDRTGKEPAWYVDYIDVAISRPDGLCTQINFPVNNWLGSLAHPSEITILLDGCHKRIHKMNSPAEIIY